MIRTTFAAISLALAFHVNLVDATGTVRIVSGQDAPRTRYSYIVSLRSATTGRHACGGSLIASDIVLTAAHCNSSDRVWIGAYSQNDVLAGQEEIEIQQQIQHPLRQTISSKDHDVRILILKKNSTFPLMRLNQRANFPQPGLQH